MKSVLALSILSLGILVAGQQQGETIRCGRNVLCPPDYWCVPDSVKCLNTNRCPAHCEFYNQYDDCGGNRIKPKNCPPFEKCLPDPRVPGTNPDIPGICIPDRQPKCSGIRGLQCPGGLTCYDLPLDGCDPLHGGADCLGVCL